MSTNPDGSWCCAEDADIVEAGCVCTCSTCSSEPELESDAPKHSRGPWRTGAGMFEAVFDADDKIVCRLSQTDYRTGKEVTRSPAEDLANAKLLAAGPELLEALSPFARAAVALAGSAGYPDKYQVVIVDRGADDLVTITGADLEAARELVARLG